MAVIQNPVTTDVPVYDTAWQLFGGATVAEAETYFDKLAEYGFAGCWAFVLHHDPYTIVGNYRNGGTIGFVNGSSQLRLNSGYITRVTDILNAAAARNIKIGFGLAWQNTYLPGGGTGAAAARGILTTSNAADYMTYIAGLWDGHSAIEAWLTGGDAGTNNTDANIQVWRNMATAYQGNYSEKPFWYHSPTSNGNEGSTSNPFRHLNYQDETWLSVAGIQSGHSQDASTTQTEMTTAVSTYNAKGIDVWEGEPRYYKIDFTWIPVQFRCPDEADVVATAQAGRNAGVQGYVYGDSRRWNWMGGFGTCDVAYSPANLALTFGTQETSVLEVFAAPSEVTAINNGYAAGSLSAQATVTNGPATGWTWTIDNGGTVTSGQGTSNATFAMTANGTYTIGVTATTVNPNGGTAVDDFVQVVNDLGGGPPPVGDSELELTLTVNTLPSAYFIGIVEDDELPENQPYNLQFGATDDFQATEFRVTIQRDSDDEYWNGTDWQVASTYVTVDVADSTLITGAYVTPPLLESETYLFTVQAVDSEGELSPIVAGTSSLSNITTGEVVSNIVTSTETQADPLSHPALTGFYRVLYADVATGLIHGELPLAALSWSRVLNGAGHIAARIPLDVGYSDIGLTQTNLLPGRTALWVERGGVIVKGGIIVGYPTLNLATNSVDIEAQGFHAYYRRRVLRATKHWFDTEQLTIAKELVDVAAADIRVETASMTSGVVRTRRYPWWTFQNIGQAVEQLANTDDGFDFHHEYRWDNTTGLPTALWTPIYPKTGRDTNIVFDVDANCDYSSVQVDGTGLGNTVITVGAGEGDATVFDVQTDGGQLAAFPPYEDVNSYTDVVRLETLQEHGRERLKRIAQPITRARVTVRRDAGPQIGTFQPGDRVTFRASQGWWEETGTYRIVGYNVSMGSGEEVVTVDLAPLVVFT